MKKLTVFDALNAINYKKPFEYDKKIVNSYMLMMWLSHAPDLIGRVNDMNDHLFTLRHPDKDKLVYQYFQKGVPKRKRFIKWTKKDKVVKSFDKFVEKLGKEMESEQLSKRELVTLARSIKAGER